MSNILGAAYMFLYMLFGCTTSADANSFSTPTLSHVQHTGTRGGTQEHVFSDAHGDMYLFRNIPV